MKPGSGAHHTLLREVQPSSSRANFSIQDLETVFREEGSPSKDFVYDAEHGLYRFPDGEFAFSREYANDLGNESGYGPLYCWFGYARDALIGLLDTILAAHETPD